MSKINILDFHKNMKSFLQGIAGQAEQKTGDSKKLLQDIRKMEEDLAKRLEDKKKQAEMNEVPVQHAEEKKPEEPKAEIQKHDEPVNVPEKTDHTSEKKEAEKPVRQETPVEEKPVAEEKPVETKKKEKKAPKQEKTEPEQKEAKPQEKEPEAVQEPKEKKPAFQVYRPDLSAFKPAIRVVRTAKDEAEQQKKREEKQRSERAAQTSKPQFDRNRDRNGKPQGQQGKPAAQQRGRTAPGEGGKFDKDEELDRQNQKKPAQQKAKKTVFVAPAAQQRDRHGSAHDQKKRLSEEEMAAKRRRNTMKERAFMSDDEEFTRSAKKNKKKDQRGAFSQEIMKIDKASMTGEMISIKDLAEKIGKPASDIIKKLFMLGNICTINSEIDYDTASLIALDYGIELEQKKEITAEDALISGFEDAEDTEEDLITRPPVVTVMGHVDHGKTSLLDEIRKTKVQMGEAGGITQHIGAYTVKTRGRQITFLDTPGHAAFTAMRARGAQATDIAVLVVAADDGVMPQTVEAINHAKSAEVPIIVAINKIDKPAANIDRVKQELTEYGLVAEEWGGDTIMVPVSAVTGEGISDLLDMILLVADVQELKANPNRMAKGIIIEAKLDKGRGPVATVLVQNGTLRVQDTIVAGTAYGRVRALYDDNGKSVKSAGPSIPVEVIGFSEVPEAGDIIYAVEQDKLSKQVVEERKDKIKAEKLKSMSRVSLDDLFSKIEEGQMKDLNIIVKADVQGSVEAIKQSLEKLSNDEVRVKIIHGAVGAINESDILLASTSNAIIIGFNVRPEANVAAQAEKENVDVRLYRIIYNAIDDVEKAMKGLLAPTFKEEVLGHATVRQIFRVSAVGTIAGSYVTDGKIVRNAGVRLVRNGIVVYEGKLSSLKRFKDDAREVQAGYECGLTLESYNDIKEEDVIEAYQEVEVKKD